MGRLSLDSSCAQGRRIHTWGRRQCGPGGGRRARQRDTTLAEDGYNRTAALSGARAWTIQAGTAAASVWERLIKKSSAAAARGWSSRWCEAPTQKQRKAAWPPSRR